MIQDRESTCACLWVPCLSCLQPIVGWIHLQHTRIAVAFARWSFLLFIGIKTIKIPAGKCDSYTRMLQMNYREQSGRGRKSRNTVFVSQASGVAVWRWKSCLLLLRFLFPLLLFFLYMTSARAQNRHSKFQFHSESVSNLLGHAYQFLDMSVKPSLDYVRLFDFCIFSFRWLKNCLESQR